MLQKENQFFKSFFSVLLKNDIVRFNPDNLFNILRELSKYEEYEDVFSFFNINDNNEISKIQYYSILERFQSKGLISSPILESNDRLILINDADRIINSNESIYQDIITCIAKEYIYLNIMNNILNKSGKINSILINDDIEEYKNRIHKDMIISETRIDSDLSLNEDNIETKDNINVRKYY